LDSETWPQAKIQPAGAGLALLFLTYSLWIHVDLSFIAFCARLCAAGRFVVELYNG
jgi:hypothetical protein